LDQRRVAAESEVDTAVVAVVAADDFDKKKGKRELQQWMGSSFLEVVVAPGKYKKPAAAVVVAAEREGSVVVVGARSVVGAAVADAVADAAGENHLKEKNGCPLDMEKLPERPWTGFKESEPKPS
jgi:hypothetical protein